jgi:hypothetical protein
MLTDTPQRLKTRKNRPARIIGSPWTPISPHPGYTVESLTYPWRFAVGEWVHVYGFPENRTVCIEAGLFRRGLPLYRTRSSSGQELLVYQIHLSSVPFSTLRRHK